MKEEEIESMRKVFGNLKDRIEPLIKTPKIKALQERASEVGAIIPPSSLDSHNMS